MNKYVYPVIGEKKIREILSADIMLLMRFVPNAPEDFLAELDRNEPARNRFYALSQKEQQHIIGQAQSVKDIYEMRTLVDSIRA